MTKENETPPSAPSDRDFREPTVETLHIQINRLEWVLVMLLLIGLGFACVIAVTTSMMIPRFSQIFSEMLGGRPLPGITRLILDLAGTGLLPLLSVLLPFTAAGILVVKRRAFVPWLIAVCVILFLIATSLLISIGLISPLLSIITRLNSAP